MNETQVSKTVFGHLKARCELYFSVPLKDKSEEEKVSYLLIWSGDDGIKLVSTWSLSITDLVNTEKGGILWRNRRHLRATEESFQFRNDGVPDDVSVADVADHEEHRVSSAPVPPESAACSSAESPESASLSSTPYSSPVLPLRRSSRRVKAPDRLNL